MRKNEIRISTLLGKDAVIAGAFTAPGSVRIDGRIEGDVEVEETLILGTSGSITGNVKAKAAIIGGEINGDVDAPDKVELSSTARLIGDVTTATIVIDEHAIFQGGCNMGQEMPERSSRSYEFKKAVKTDKKDAKNAVSAALSEMSEAAES